MKKAFQTLLAQVELFIPDLIWASVLMSHVSE